MPFFLPLSLCKFAFISLAREIIYSLSGYAVGPKLQIYQSFGVYTVCLHIYPKKSRSRFRLYSLDLDLWALFRLFPSASLLVAHLGLNPVRVS